jgi:GNAT superfamily N-acetyltransferase
MQEKNIIIREAELTDVPALSGLMNELGYSTTENEMLARFRNIQSHTDFKTFVAMIDTQVVGMIGLTRNYSYEENGIYVRVLALVTSYKLRQNGIGKRLMQVAEDWAKEIGANKILLNCGNREERKVAHSFYKKIGYEVRSSGFTKRI